MPSTNDTLIENSAGISGELLSKLHAAWIRTAEQLVASTGAAGGAATMADHLGVPLAEFNRALVAAEAVIPAATLRRLKAPVDTHGRGLGANPPSDE